MTAHRYDALVALLLAALTALTLGRVCAHDFTNFDDPEYVTDNPHVQGGLTAEGFRWALTATYAANWHPLTWISLQLDATLYGSRPWGFHLTNLVLHAANAIVLYEALRRMTGAVWPSAWAAALFAVHPLHVESVAWVSERKDVLSTLFWMLALLAYAWYSERPRVTRYLVVAGLLALGLTAKPMLVTLPCVLLLLDYWPLRRAALASEDWRRWAGLAAEKVPLFGLAAASAVITLVAQRGAMTSLDLLPLPARLANALLAYVRYLGMAFWPTRLAPHYPHAGWQGAAAAAGAAALLLAVSAVAVWQARRRPYILVGWLWYLGTLVPVIGLVQVGDQALADRYTYVPLVGILLMVAWAAKDLVAARPGAVRAVATAAAAVVLACAAGSWVQAGYWQDSRTLWSHTLDVRPDDHLALNNNGLVLLREGSWDEAARHFAAALRLRPTFVDARNNLGLTYLRQGRPELARAEFQLALELRPGSAVVHANLGRAAYQQRRFAEARAEFTRALELDPERQDARTDLGSLLLTTGELEAAREQFARVVAARPQSAAAHRNLGLALFRLGSLGAARGEFRQAVAIDPDDVAARDQLANVANNIAWELATHPDAGRRNGALALERAREACEADRYRKAEYLDTLAAAYAEVGRFDDAASTLHKALALATAERKADLVRQLEDHLRHYQQGRPLREG